MVQRFVKITDFGVYDLFEWGKVSGLQDFNDKNIIYGWNYSGKTTLSRIFKSLKDRKLHSDFENGKFKVKTEKGEFDSVSLDDFPYDIEVFNSEYIRENLRWEFDENINAISFEVGESVKVKEQIKECEERIKSINGDELLIGEKHKHLAVVQELNAFDDKFTKEAKRIKNDAFSSLIEFRKDHLRKVLTTVIGDLDSNIISSHEELARLAVAVKIEKANAPIDQVTFSSKYALIYKNSTTALRREPKKEEVIKCLETIDSFYWAKKGLELHDVGDTCKFCGSDLKSERIDKLIAYFSNEVGVLRQRIQEILLAIETELQVLDSINLPNSINDFNEGFKYLFEKAKAFFDDKREEYKKALFSIKDQLIIKQEMSLYTAVELAASSDIGSELTAMVDDINDIIKKNNLFVENFEKELEIERDKYKKHLVASYLRTENYSAVFKKAEHAQSEVAKLDDEVLGLKDKIQELEAEINKISLGCVELNSFIRTFLNRDDISIVVNDEKNGFNLKRGNVLAKNLSEGEKSAIAFSYFLVHLESLFKAGKLLDKIIFIDDPISSLDTNHIAKIYSIINSFFFRQGLDPADPNKVVNCFKQLFISTHNFEFFSFLKDSHRLKRKKKVIKDEKVTEIPSVEYYFVKKIGLTSSTLTPLPQSLRKYKSEYVLLFSQIFSFYAAGCDISSDHFILMPNAIRRFLEMYTLMKIPHIADELDNRLNELVGDAVQIKFLHHFSHFTSFEKILKYDDLIAILPDATNELISILERDPTHFQSLKRSINVN